MRVKMLYYLKLEKLLVEIEQQKCLLPSLTFIHVCSKKPKPGNLVWFDYQPPVLRIK